MHAAYMEQSMPECMLPAWYSLHEFAGNRAVSLSWACCTASVVACQLTVLHVANYSIPCVQEG